MKLDPPAQASAPRASRSISGQRLPPVATSAVIHAYGNSVEAH